MLKAGDEQVINDILRGKRVDITFSDTYVNSALAALMLVYLLKELRDMYAFTISSVTLNIKSPKRNCVNPLWNDNSYISFNFPNESDADSYIRECFDGWALLPFSLKRSLIIIAGFVYKPKGTPPIWKSVQIMALAEVGSHQKNTSPLIIWMDQQRLNSKEAWKRCIIC